MNKRIILLTTLALLIAPANAGDLNPPPGAPQSTMKTLDEVEPRIPIDALPYTINQPGSYQLTGNLTAAAAGDYITISASDVAIDFKGFTIDGAGVADYGVRANGTRTNLIMTNGVIRDCDGPGADLTSINECAIEQMQLYNNQGDGLSVGFASVVRECHARSNLGAGINGRFGTEILNSIAAFNGASGLVVEAEGLVIGCTSRGNGDATVLLEADQRGTLANLGAGIAVGDNSRVAQCVATANAVHGIETTAHCTVEQSVAAQNNISGIKTADHCVIIACAARENGQNPPPPVIFPNSPDDITLYAGICAGEANTINDCAVTANIGGGIIALLSSSLDSCAATGNGDTALIVTSPVNRGVDLLLLVRTFALVSGINADAGSTVTRVASGENVFCGVNTGAGAVVTQSVAESNGFLFPEMRGGSGTPYTGEGRAGAGFVVNERSLVSECAAIANVGIGMFVLPNSVVTDSIACNNDLSGFDGDDGVHFKRLLAAGNGDVAPPPVSQRGFNFPIAGIRSVANRTRIDSCHAVQNNVGFFVDGTFITFVRNSAQSNTNGGAELNFTYNFFNQNQTGDFTDDPATADPYDNFDIDQLD